MGTEICIVRVMVQTLQLLAQLCSTMDRDAELVTSSSAMTIQNGACSIIPSPSLQPTFVHLTTPSPMTMAAGAILP